jgi:hypothetical protein
MESLANCSQMTERSLIVEQDMLVRNGIKLLREAYEASGYIRVKMDRRRGGHRSGWEIRLIAADERMARLFCQALRDLGMKPGTVYAKRGLRVVPLYGIKQVRRFLNDVRPAIKSGVPQPPDKIDIRFKAARQSIESPDGQQS